MQPRRSPSSCSVTNAPARSRNAGSVTSTAGISRLFTAASIECRASRKSSSFSDSESIEAHLPLRNLQGTYGKSHRSTNGALGEVQSTKYKVQSTKYKVQSTKYK